FQADDGIRYYKVTGVQTCALPISAEALAVCLHRTGQKSLRRASVHTRTGVRENVLGCPGNEDASAANRAFHGPVLSDRRAQRNRQRAHKRAARQALPATPKWRACLSSAGLRANSRIGPVQK